MSPVRAGLGALGVLAATYGAWLLLSREDLEQIVSAALWLAGGVLAHDLLLSGVLLLLGLLGTRVLPSGVRAPVAAGLVVLGSVTLLAVPVLGRFGARSDNPTLLDRDYTAGWLVVVGLVVLVLGAVTLVRSRRG